MLFLRFAVGAFVAGALWLGFAASPAQAQPPLTLALQSPVSTQPGQTVTFTGRITDPITNNVVVNNIQFSFVGNAGSFLLVNQATYNLFYANVPGVFDAGDDITTPVFSLQAAANTPTGDYFGTATLLGGADQNAQNVISNAAAFTVHVGGAEVPEPASLVLAALPLAGMIARRRKA